MTIECEVCHKKHRTERFVIQVWNPNTPADMQRTVCADAGRPCAETAKNQLIKEWIEEVTNAS